MSSVMWGLGGFGSALRRHPRWNPGLSALLCLALATGASAQLLDPPGQGDRGAQQLRPVGARDLISTQKPDQYDDDEPAASRALSGEELARRDCVLCHAFVEPDALDKKNWREQILPRMKVRLGIAIPDFSSSPEGELIRQRKVYTEKPLVPVADWPLIEEYYLKAAPDEPLPQDPRPEITVGLKLFETVKPRFRVNPPTTTLVKVRPNASGIFVGDNLSRSLYVLNQEGVLVDTIRTENVPTDVIETDEGIYVTCVGSFVPSEVYRGEFLYYAKQGNGFGEKKVILKELPRPVMAQFADFNGDGKRDFALCMFGNLTGRFSWFENLGPDQYREHILSAKAGSITCVAHDFNGDGKPDLGVLFAQELEMMVLMLNDGRGGFSSEMVFQRPPVYGDNYFELADMDGDGKPEIISITGDNGEYESPMKKYHGIRILKDRGQGKYEEIFFYPMNGCYKAVARDFDGDGDMDLAAVSFFPDYVKSPKESFVYLENLGGLKFATSTYRECIAGRWVVMDAADIDGDGDEDLVLGSCTLGPTAVPEFLSKIWAQNGPSIQILRNLSRERAGSAGNPPSPTPTAPATK